MPADEEHELVTVHSSARSQEEEMDTGRQNHPQHGSLSTEDTSYGLVDGSHREVSSRSEAEDDLNHDDHRETEMKRRTLFKLDTILLPFLSILFLLNSLDKSNIGNAETAGFTHDAGLEEKDINIAMACFFAFFVALQPLGAALGRRYGMTRWVPACMSLWGLSTILHLFVRSRWQLITLRIAIATLEAGFYPTTVSYLSLFYTRYEFAVRLGFFYGQTAVAGALGGVLSWAVFSSFPHAKPSVDGDNDGTARWKGWQILFLVEGCMTITIALLGFKWLPHSAGSAWFFSPIEKQWSEKRIYLDQEKAASSSSAQRRQFIGQIPEEPSSYQHDADVDEIHQRLLATPEPSSAQRRKLSPSSALSATADSGLSKHDVISAFFQYKIWHLLLCNILSAIPATAFGIFLPMVIKQLSPSLNLSPAASNLLTAPPFAFGAITLFLFTRWSDRSHQRLIPVLWGLGILLLGLIWTVITPSRYYITRYIGLCVLFSGSFVASPLTVAWISNNTPEAGKRAILLGINGWGNLAGVSSAFLFTPDDAANGYVRSLIITLLCVLASLVGYIVFMIVLARGNRSRDNVIAGWSDDQRQREEIMGDVHISSRLPNDFYHNLRLNDLLRLLGSDDLRRGDDRLTYRYTF